MTGKYGEINRAKFFKSRDGFKNRIFRLTIGVKSTSKVTFSHMPFLCFSKNCIE